MNLLSAPRHALIISLFYVSVCAGIIFWFFTPMYSTNDDIWRSMRIHGYGVFEEPSYHILYSNVVWGWILYQLPSDIGGITGYSIAFMSLYVVSIWLITYVLLRVTAHISVLIVPSLFLIDWLTEPQFTILAAALATGAFLTYWAYERMKEPWVLGFATMLGFLGAMVRIESFMAVFLLALIFLLRRSLFAQRQLMIHMAVLCIVIIGGLAIDSYVTNQDPHYKKVRELRISYRPVVDYGVLRYFVAHPERLSAHNASILQLEMIKNRLWLSSSTLSPQDVQSITDSISVVDSLLFYLPQSLDQLGRFSHYTYVPLLGFAVLLAWFGRSWRGVWLIIWLLAIVFIIFLTGRNIPVRVAYPLVTFVFVMVAASVWSKVRLQRLFGVLLVSMVITGFVQTSVAYEQNTLRESRSERVQHVMREYGMQDIVVWAGDEVFGSVLIYPVFLRDSALREIHYVNMNISQVEFGSVYAASGFDFDSRFVSADGILMVTSKYRLSLLKSYCEERLLGQFSSGMVRQKGFPVRNVKCMIP